jgi:hypothetical protein
MRLDNKLNARLSNAVGQGMELIHSQRQTHVRDRHLIAIHRIVKVWTAIVVAYPVADNLMAV